MVSFCIFSAPLLVIRGSPPGIRSGQRKRRGPIQLSHDPSNGPRVPDPTLATVERAATLSQRSLLASAARKVIRQAGIAGADNTTRAEAGFSRCLNFRVFNAIDPK